MSVAVTCPQCEATERVNVRLAGRRVRCRHCNAVMQVPAVAVEEPDAFASESPEEPGLTAGDDSEAQAVPAPAATPSELEKFSVSLAALTDGEPAVDLQPEFHAAPLTDSTLGSLKFGQIHEHQVLVLDDEPDHDQVLKPAKRPEEELDMTPMVDVTFLLLIFFMVTAAFSLQKSIEVPRQDTDAPSVNVQEEEEDMDMVEIQVDEYGSFLVLAPEWERETPGKQNLITALREAIAGARDGMRLTVKVHEEAKLQALVDAMDAGTIAGYSDLKVTQVSEFD